MQSLATRHEDRAKRKAQNLLASEDVTVESLAFVESGIRNAKAAFDRLSPEQQEEVQKSLDASGGETNRSLAEDETGVHTLAGIGTTNTAVVPAVVIAKEESGEGSAGPAVAASKDAGWGATPPPSVKTPASAEPIDGNLGGEALKEQGAGSTLQSGEGTDGGETGNGGGSGEGGWTGGGEGGSEA